MQDCDLVKGVGFSEYTKTKQFHFSKILRTHLKATEAILNKYKKETWAEQRYWYFDINAGPGVVGGIEGSPLLFLKEVKKHKMDYKAVFIEKEKTNYLLLVNRVYDYLAKNYERINTHCANHNNLLLEYVMTSKIRYGLLYADPTGSIPPFDLLKKFFRHRIYKRLDVLISCPCTNIKRVRAEENLRIGEPETLSLIEYLKLIDKEYWIVREPYHQHQWSFIIGTQWDSFPKFENLGFFRTDSLKGKEILKKLSFTREELKC
jgi:three-Cys-motif partner protein